MLACLFGLVLQLVATSAAAGASVAVIYPKLGEPYRSMFAEVVGGIEEKIGGQVAIFPISEPVDVGKLNEDMQRQGVKVAIALGQQGLTLASRIDRNIAVVVGSVFSTQSSKERKMRVHTLLPDPVLLFKRLKGLMPNARRVFVVYDPRQNGWLIERAKEAARAHGMELEAYEAQDLRSAMHAYQEIMASADSARDAIWLPQDSTTVEDRAVLPLVLRESWQRHLVVFSSSLRHVSRGVLFALYPDNVELGRRLAVSAQEILVAGADDASGMMPLRAVQMGINLRVARHLELDVGSPDSYALSYPAR